MTNGHGSIVPISLSSAHEAMSVQIRNFVSCMEQIACLRLKQVRNVGRSPAPPNDGKMERKKMSKEARSLLIRSKSTSHSMQKIHIRHVRWLFQAMPCMIQKPKLYIKEASLCFYI